MWLSNIPILTSGHPVNARDGPHPHSQVLNPYPPFSQSWQTPDPSKKFCRTSQEKLHTHWWHVYHLVGKCLLGNESSGFSLTPCLDASYLIVRLLRGIVCSDRADGTSLMVTMEAGCWKDVEDMNGIYWIMFFLHPRKFISDSWDHAFMLSIVFY